MGETKRCCTCGEVRSLAQFNLRRAAPDSRQSRGRDCARAWYLAHRDEHQVNTRRRTAAVRLEHKRRIGEHLRAHPCVDCGESDVRVLDFDHDVGVSKTKAVAALVAAGGSWSVIEAEIAEVHGPLCELPPSDHVGPGPGLATPPRGDACRGRSRDGAPTAAAVLA